MTRRYHAISRILILGAVARGFFGCSNCEDDWYSKHLIHDFYLEWIKSPKTQQVTQGSWECGVGGNLPITDETVFAVGFDTSFIIVKSHPDREGEIRARLFVDTNSKGDFSIASPEDTIYLHQGYYRDSIYEEDGKWYHTGKDWFGSADSFYLDKEKTTYYIIDIRNFSQIIDYQREKTYKYEDENGFLRAREKLGVRKDLDFTIINKSLE